MNFSSDAFLAYACGVTLLALAALLAAVNRRSARARHGWWLVGFAIAQCLSECLAVADSSAGRSAVAAVASGALDFLSLVALIEFSRGASPSGGVFQRRWLYLPAIALVGAAAVGDWRWFHFGISLLIAVQGGMLIARQLIQCLVEEERLLLPAVAAFGAAAFLVANVLESPNIKLAGLVGVGTAAWLIQLLGHRFADRRPVKWLCAGAILYGGLLFVGGVLLENARQADELITQSHEQLTLLADVESAANNDGPRWLQACCLALAPPVVLIALGWAISKLRTGNARIGV